MWGIVDIAFLSFIVLHPNTEEGADLQVVTNDCIDFFKRVRTKIPGGNDLCACMH